ncbi:(2Fe-2S)-binding protein [Phytohabitans kaempferiae]|uniref:(2Fe-2S)-binding protein n=1 Tax=Phytohabitans kaempferiae TaxID=1620943 RepID=A0ABV6MA36_9ACTN
MSAPAAGDVQTDRTVDVVVVGHDEAAFAAVDELRRRGAEVVLADDRQVQVWAVTPLDEGDPDSTGDRDRVGMVVDLAVDGLPSNTIGCRAVVSALSEYGTIPLVPGGEHADEPGEPLDDDVLLVGGHLGATEEALRHGTPREVWLPFGRAALLRHLLRAPALLRIGALPAVRLLVTLRRRGVRVRFGTALAALERAGDALRAHPRGVGVDGALTVRRVIVADSRIPPSELARSVGARSTWDAVLGGWVVVNDAPLLSVVAAGAAAGVRGPAGLAAHGVLVADEIAALIGLGGGPASGRRTALRRAVRRGRQLARWQAGIAGRTPLPGAGASADTIVCACEGVTLGDLEAIVPLLPDPPTPRDVKSVTRAGMGLCQGRRCAAAVTAWAQRCGRVSTDVLDAGLRPRLPLAPLVLRPPAPSRAHSADAEPPGNDRSFE